MVGLALCGAACHSEFQSPALGVKYHPPNGFNLVSEEGGAQPVARWSPGLEIRSVGVDPKGITNSKLEGMVGGILTAAGLPPTRQVVSARAGTLPVGEVMRAELDDGDTMTLLYYIPLQGRFLLVRLVASPQRFGELEARVEASLASLKLLPH